ncbi:hypothetical protein SAMN04489859_101420 [Paracoccus alcaliphilus]|uniref:Inner membrane protein n=1 Tax=Paracoccus alcaliphilus TaxID=34002 RepID=A0A1H8ITE9_9RHOB|nr:hypothetical protein [Paracoccus alcaliphilus]WCR18269.1 hypothetical protein JHW40_00385 [Paracoccus alcaliphilus]SEN71649.1 hypothetical protein SAMN04489859_101420 [Paracoccus alcaliphilus]
MTRADETKPSDKANSPAEPENTAKKQAAAPGVIATTDVGTGRGDAAMPRGAEISPVDSTLLGDSTDGRPAAARKPDDAGKSDDSAKGDDSARAVPLVPKAADAEPAKPARSEPTPAPVQRVTVQKTGFWPVVLGGVVAAGLGSAATIYALPYLPAGWLPADEAAIDADAVVAEAVAAAQESAQQLVDDFAASIEMPAPAEGAESGAADVQDIDTLRQEIADLRARVDDQSSRLDELQAAPDAQPAQTATDEGQPEAGDPAAIDTLRQDIADLRAQLEDQTGRIDQMQAGPELDPAAVERIQALAEQADQLEQRITSAAEEASQQIGAAQAEAEQLQAAAVESTRRAEAVAAIAALQAALDRGSSGDEARQALDQAGIATPEALQQDVPSLVSLQESFGDASRAALRAALREDSSGGGNVVTNFLRAQTGARSVTPREGDDPDAILSRAGAEVEAGRIAEALDEMTALPEAARNAPTMAEWLSGATAWRDARAALSDLTDTTE